MACGWVKLNTLIVGMRRRLKYGLLGFIYRGQVMVATILKLLLLLHLCCVGKYKVVQI